MPTFALGPPPAKDDPNFDQWQSLAYKYLQAISVLASSGFVNQGTTTTVLHGNAAGNPSWGAVVEADITLSANTTNNVSTAKHGFAPVLPNDATKFLDGTGAYSVPAGTGVTSVGGTAPIASSGGTTPAISLNANGVTPHYLSADIFAFAHHMMG